MDGRFLARIIKQRNKQWLGDDQWKLWSSAQVFQNVFKNENTFKHILALQKSTKLMC